MMSLIRRIFACAFLFGALMPAAGFQSARAEDLASDSRCETLKGTERAGQELDAIRLQPGEIRVVTWDLTGCATDIEEYRFTIEGPSRRTPVDIQVLNLKTGEVARGSRTVRKLRKAAGSVIELTVHLSPEATQPASVKVATSFDMGSRPLFTRN